MTEAETEHQKRLKEAAQTLVNTIGRTATLDHLAARLSRAVAAASDTKLLPRERSIKTGHALDLAEMHTYALEMRPQKP